MCPAEIGKILSKHITLTDKQWAKLYNRLAQDHHSSVLLIREKMKVVLGFTVRRHNEWVKDSSGYPDLRDTICLDFYNEPKRTMFLLKYGEFLNDN